MHVFAVEISRDKTVVLPHVLLASWNLLLIVASCNSHLPLCTPQFCLWNF